MTSGAPGKRATTAGFCFPVRMTRQMSVPSGPGLGRSKNPAPGRECRITLYCDPPVANGTRAWPAVCSARRIREDNRAGHGGCSRSPGWLCAHRTCEPSRRRSRARPPLRDDVSHRGSTWRRRRARPGRTGPRPTARSTIFRSARPALADQRGYSNRRWSKRGSRRYPCPSTSVKTGYARVGNRRKGAEIILGP